MLKSILVLNLTISFLDSIFCSVSSVAILSYICIENFLKVFAKHSIYSKWHKNHKKFFFVVLIPIICISESKYSPLMSFRMGSWKCNCCECLRTCVWFVIKIYFSDIKAIRNLSRTIPASCFYDSSSSKFMNLLFMIWKHQ